MFMNSDIHKVWSQSQILVKISLFMREKLSESADLHQAPNFSTFCDLHSCTEYMQLVVVEVERAVAMTIDKTENFIKTRS